MKNKFAVIGLGRFGTSIARTLADRGAEVLAIDNRPEKVEDIKDQVAYAVVLDSRDARALMGQNIQEMDAIVVAIGEDFEALLLTTVMLQEMGVKRIIARASSLQQRMILDKLGVAEILSPEDEVGRTVAEMVLHPNMRKYMPMPDGYEIAEITAPKGLANRTVEEIGLRERYNINLITIRRLFPEEIDGQMVMTEHITGVITDSTMIYSDDVLVVMGKVEDVDRFSETKRL